MCVRSQAKERWKAGVLSVCLKSRSSRIPFRTGSGLGIESSSSGTKCHSLAPQKSHVAKGANSPRLLGRSRTYCSDKRSGVKRRRGLRVRQTPRHRRRYDEGGRPKAQGVRKSSSPGMPPFRGSRDGRPPSSSLPQDADPGWPTARPPSGAPAEGVTYGGVVLLVPRRIRLVKALWADADGLRAPSRFPDGGSDGLLGSSRISGPAGCAPLVGQETDRAAVA